MNFFSSFLKQTVNALKKLCLEVFVVNRRIRRVMKGDICKHYLKKYVKVVKENSQWKPSTAPARKVIWQYWEQGLQNAPEIVKACMASVERFRGDYEVIVIDQNNISDYVEIPEFIMKLKSKGIIKSAHFSDILRSCLLLKHGGTWIDATVLLTDKIPEFILNSELFVFQNYVQDDLDGLNMASYFIHANPNNKILFDTMTVLKEYWRDNNFLVNYFTFLHAFTMVTQANEENRELFKQVPFESFIPVQRFQYELTEPFREDRWVQIKQMSPIHKLSFKDKAIFGKEKHADLSGTFLEKILLK